MSKQKPRYGLCKRCKKPITRFNVPDVAVLVFDGELMTYTVQYRCPCGFSNEDVVGEM